MKKFISKHKYDLMLIAGLLIILLSGNIEYL